MRDYQEPTPPPIYQQIAQRDPDKPFNIPRPQQRLWNMRPATRRLTLQPFLGQCVRIEQVTPGAAETKRREGRVVSIAILTSGVGFTLILRSPEGTDWAIPPAQIALIEWTAA